LEEIAHTHYTDNAAFIDDIRRRTLRSILDAKTMYFTHPKIQKSFWELKREMNEFLSTPIVRKYIKKTRFKDIRKIVGFKGAILLKLQLYWVFLITERSKRRAAWKG